MALPTKHKDYGGRILRLGIEDGLDIWNLQVKLIGWGSGTDNEGIGNLMDPMRLSGKFDTTTRDAVMRFQQAHRIPVTGCVDGPTFRAIDREVALHPVVMSDLRCPCVTGANDGPIPCQCAGMENTPPTPKKHEEEGKCNDGTGKTDGFGKGRFADKFLLDDIKLGDGTELKDEKLDLYDKQEYPGMDKAVLWAARAILHRTGIQKGTTFKQIKVVAGYRCWHDNYHNTDDSRWRHRRSTFHFGKAIEFYVLDYGCEPKKKDGVDQCPKCKALQETALAKCGFQLRWQQPGRVSLAENEEAAAPPSTPFAVHVDTVRLHPRKDGKLDYSKADDFPQVFAQTDLDAANPLYNSTVTALSFPVVLDSSVTDECPEPNLAAASDSGAAAVEAKLLKIRAALDPRVTASDDFFRNTETGKGGWFPVGASRIWHGGIHLYAAEGAPVHAIADGEIVGCRVGDGEEQDNGSRNFVVLRHTIKADGAWKDKVFYSLYLHLDAETAKADADVRWRRELFQRSSAHVEALVPSPLFAIQQVETKDRLLAKAGLGAGESAQTSGDAARAKTKDDSFPDTDDWMIIKVTSPTDHYFFTKREGKDMGEKRDALTIPADKAMGLEKPIRVMAGEVLGRVAKKATADPIKSMDSFLHLEVFAESELPLDGAVKIDASAAAKLADRKAVLEALSGDSAKLLPQAPDGVMTTKELAAVYSGPPYAAGLRSTQLKMPSAWSVEWKKALTDAKLYGFGDTDTLGTAWETYNWWKAVKDGKGNLPASPDTLYHYHPIALIMQLAYA